MANKTVTRSTLVDTLRKEVGLSKTDTTELLEEFLRTVSDCLAEGEPTRIHGFGNFSVRHKRARVGRNPRTGEEAQVSARHVVVFKPSGKLKAQINDPDAPQGIQIKCL